MKYLIYTFAILGTIALWSCSDDDSTEDKSSITLNFKAVFEDQPLIMFEKNALSTMDLCIERFSFLITDIRLVDASGNATQVLDAAHVDFTEQNEDVAGANVGVDVRVDDLEVGDFTAIRIGLGVEPTLNTTAPDAYSVTHPLGQASEYWSGWNSYIFTKIEGKADTTNSGMCDQSFVYHTGFDSSYRDIEFVAPINLASDQGASLQFSIDLKRIFETNGQVLDLAQIHNLNDEAFMNLIADNLVLATSMSPN